jgi:hypothetical protein
MIDDVLPNSIYSIIEPAEQKDNERRTPLPSTPREEAQAKSGIALEIKRAVNAEIRNIESFGAGPRQSLFAFEVII